MFFNKLFKFVMLIILLISFAVFSGCGGEGYVIPTTPGNGDSVEPISEESSSEEVIFNSKDGVTFKSAYTGFLIEILPVEDEGETLLKYEAIIPAQPLEEEAMEIYVIHKINFESTKGVNYSPMAKLTFPAVPDKDIKDTIVLHDKGDGWMLTEGDVEFKDEGISIEVKEFSSFTSAYIEPLAGTIIGYESGNLQFTEEGNVITPLTVSSYSGWLWGVGSAPWFSLEVLGPNNFISAEAPGDYFFGLWKENYTYLSPGEEKELELTFYGVGGKSQIIMVNNEFDVLIPLWIDGLYTAWTGDKLPWPISDKLIEQNEKIKKLVSLAENLKESISSLQKGESIHNSLWNFLNWLKDKSIEWAKSQGEAIIESKIPSVWINFAKTTYPFISTTVYTLTGEGFQQLGISVNTYPELNIDPKEITVKTGETVQFQSQITSKFTDRPLSCPGIIWSVVEGKGTITQEGLYTAGTESIDTIRAKVLGMDTLGESTVIVSESPTIIYSNQPPSIIYLFANPSILEINETTTITCTASDPDGDYLSYTWTKNGGTFEGSTIGSNVTWRAPNTQGNYTITCIVNDGEVNSEPDNVIINVTESTTIPRPDAPTSLSPGTISAPGPIISTLTPTLQWQAVSNADYYNLSVSIYPYGTSNIIYYNQQIYGNSITVPSGELEAGNKYRWNMRAHNSAGYSEYSSDYYFQTESITCTAPGSFALTSTPECNGTVSQIRLNWTNSSGASSYDVYRNNTLYYSDLTGTQFINSGNITAGTSYSYYIVAKNSCDSTTSNIVSATAINCDSTVPASINSYSPSSKITINTGQSFTISTSFTNTGNTAAYFYAGVSIWNSNGNVIFNGWGGKTYLNKGQQGSASWNHTINIPGEYWIQFGVWNEAKSELLDKKPSPSQNLIKVVLLSSQTERLTNGSFSSGTSGWNLVGDFWAGTNLSNYRTPPGYAAGGVNSAGLPINNAVGYMYQTVNIPSGATSATLSFWYNITSEEAGSTAYDVLNVTIKNSTGNYLATVAVLSNLNKSSLGSYSKITFNVTPYKGQTIRVHFLATTDSSVYTVFRIDDVSLMSDG